jgi:inosine-uridine nucleoside N-ribohydrolase
VIRIHLDTDLGSDTDDLCALAMLLGSRDVELTGITTVNDPAGVRAGMVAVALRLAGRIDVPVAAGAAGSLGGFSVPLAFPDYWPEPIGPRPSPAGEALALLQASIDAGAKVVAIGPYTNLAAFEAWRPGQLASAGAVVMGGHVPQAPDGFPAWGMRDDFNVQQDTVAARIVFERCAPTVVPVPTCLRVAIRRRHLDRLRAAGPLGSLIADQAERHAMDQDRISLPKEFPALPDDLLNFQYDPLACAVAVGWPGAEIRELGVALSLEGRFLRMREDEAAPALRIVTDADGQAFEQVWLDAVEHASRAGA